MAEFRRVGQFGIEIGSAPAPIARERVARFGDKPSDYLELITTWGPGVAVGHIRFPDPTELDGELALLQERYRLHAPHMRATGRWTALTDADIDGANVIAYYRSGAALVATASGMTLLEPDGGSKHVYDLGMLLRNQAYNANAPGIYMTGCAPRADLFAALARGDETAADALLAQVYAHESAWGVLEIAHDLALDHDRTIANELRSTYFGQCIRLAKRTEEGLAKFPARPIADALAKRTLTADEAAEVRTLAYPQGPFGGVPDAIERELVAQILAKPDDRASCMVLADHLEERGQSIRARLVREQSEAMTYDEARAKGLIVARDIDSTKLLAEWVATWTTADPDAPIAPLVAALDELEAQHRHAMVAWLVGRELDRLVAEPAATPLLVLALRSRYTADAIDAIVAGKRTDLAPWLLRAIRTPSESRGEYGALTFWQQELAKGFCELGKLKPAEITEAVGWLTTTSGGAQQLAAAILLQGHGKNDRVFEAALAHFADISPYGEKIIGKRKTDPRVIPALRAAFAIAEKRSIADGKHVRYTEDYRILSRYLAKLGDAEGKAAWERCKKMGRVDRAAADREARREGM